MHKDIIIMAIASALLFISALALAATGNKPNQMVIPFRNVSSSTKPSGCTVGELKRNTSYVFLCSTSSKWRRIAIGEGF